MKQVIRGGVFETNSSSMHSLSINGKDNVSHPTLMNGYFGEFGWGYDTYSNPEDRLSYLLTAIAQRLQISYEYSEGNKDLFLSSKWFLWTNELIKDFTSNEISFNWENISTSYYCFGYIDHQSINSQKDDEGMYVADILSDFWSNDKNKFKENMKEFIFNNKYEIVIDNDNSPHGYTDYD